MVAMPNPRQAHQDPPGDGLPSRDEISAYHLVEEQRLVAGLIDRAVFTEDERRRTADLARTLVQAVRAKSNAAGGVDAFMAEYALSSEEGVILMCLAEALLRVPDSRTADDLIAEKIGGGHWEKHLGQSDSIFVNASTFGLMLTGRMVKFGDAKGGGPTSALKRMIAKSGEPVIRQAVRRAMKVLGDNFVLGRNITEALGRAKGLERQGYRFSYDMLGEGARTAKDADRYFAALHRRARCRRRRCRSATANHADALMSRPSLSVKLSAIHPRFEPGKAERYPREIGPRLLELARLAKARNLGLTIDAEEQDRLDITLLCSPHATSIRRSPVGMAWPRRAGLWQARHPSVALAALDGASRAAAHSGASRQGRLLGQRDQVGAGAWVGDYPVFTAKMHTDVSYLACCGFLLSDAARLLSAVRHA